MILEDNKLQDQDFVYKQRLLGNTDDQKNEYQAEINKQRTNEVKILGKEQAARRVGIHGK